MEAPTIARGAEPLSSPTYAVREASVDIRVRYSETDQMGKAHHMCYLAWFELARMELLRANGHAYADLERAGTTLSVTLAEVEHRQPLGYDEKVRISARLGEARNRSLSFSYEVRRAVDDELVARGRTVLSVRNSTTPHR
jgi:acyl-CoA thioester hydrolase